MPSEADNPSPKVFLTLLGIPLFSLVVYIFYLWLTYISDSATSGEKYGFKIGESKPEVIERLHELNMSYPALAIYVSYGESAGDNFTVAPSEAMYVLLSEHDAWKLLLDGEKQFFNSIRLEFENNQLVLIYRHRQHFELP